MSNNLPSAGETKIRSWLFINEVNYESEKEFDDLVNPYTGGKLRFDFYLPDHRMMIEYDGDHHFSPYSKRHGGDMKSFRSQKARDGIKNRYCRDNNYTLLRIPYQEDKDLYKVLNNNIDTSLSIDINNELDDEL